MEKYSLKKIQFGKIQFEKIHFTLQQKTANAKAPGREKR